MTWICERCHGYFQGDFPDRIDAWREPDLIAHSVPKDSALCFGCAVYLLWSRVFQGGIRRFWDDYYKTGAICQLGKKSRYNSVCRNFDITYGFLNPETNLYWDE